MNARLLAYSKTAKVQMACCLLLIAVTAVWHYQSLISLLTIVLAVVTTVITDFVCLKIRRVQPFFLSAAIVSGLIIGMLALIISMLAFYQLPWYAIVFAGIVAMVSKHFIHWHRRHLFNPAAFGLVAMSLVFHQTIAWWAVSFQNILLGMLPLLAFIILLTPGYVSMVRLKRYKISAAFLVVYFLLTIFIGFLRHTATIATALQGVFLSGPIVFFSIVMLPEPMTSPNQPTRQVLYGGFVAVFATVLSYLFTQYIPDPLLSALLLGNAVFSQYR